MITLPDPRDYIISIENPQLVKAAELQGGCPVKERGKLIRYTGGFCIVFPYEVSGHKYAVRCWKASVDNVKERTKLIANTLADLSLPYFVEFKYIENGIATTLGMQPIVLMDWVKAKPLKEYIKVNLSNSGVINKLADNFLQMVRDLHKHNLSHGDLQHGNILVRDDCSLVLVDYDSMYVPALEGWSDVIKGLAGYQHPARWNNKNVSPKADYFSEKVIYLSLKSLEKFPDLWNDLQMEDNDTLLFSEEDIESKGSTPIFSILKNISGLEALTENFIEDLRKDSIEHLQPLEDILISPTETIFQNWKNYTPPVRESYKKEDVKSITNKW